MVIRASYTGCRGAGSAPAAAAYDGAYDGAGF
jgi:hypothetical protein